MPAPRDALVAAVKQVDSQNEAPARGFSASLSEASLADLIQMQCLSRAHCVVRITSEEDVGYLYFREGAIVHAMSSSNVGEAAALEILGWSSGSFEPCNAGWPDSESIHTSPQALLLRAAQVADESIRNNLVQFRRSRGESSPPEPPRSTREERTAEPATTPRYAPPPDSRRVQTGSAAPVTRVQAAVRLDANGNIISNRGAGAEELAACVALVTRLGMLIGDALGLEAVRAVEASGREHVTLVVVENNGNLVGLRAPADADLTTVRERYGI